MAHDGDVNCHKTIQFIEMDKLMDCETRPECRCYFCDDESDDEQESVLTNARDN